LMVAFTSLYGSRTTMLVVLMAFWLPTGKPDQKQFSEEEVRPLSRAEEVALLLCWLVAPAVLAQSA
jgi:hypothetical protein